MCLHSLQEPSPNPPTPLVRPPSRDPDLSSDWRRGRCVLVCLDNKQESIRVIIAAIIFPSGGTGDNIEQQLHPPPTLTQPPADGDVKHLYSPSLLEVSFISLSFSMLKILEMSSTPLSSMLEMIYKSFTSLGLQAGVVRGVPSLPWSRKGLW